MFDLYALMDTDYIMSCSAFDCITVEYVMEDLLGFPITSASSSSTPHNVSPITHIDRSVHAA